LTSDLGAAYAAQMKGVLSRFVPPGAIVDLTHDLPAHDVREAAFLVLHMASRFPPGTVHVVVVDPGVGSERAALAIECRDGSRLVGPDNGVLDPLRQHLGPRFAVRLDPGRFGGPPRVGTTFDGRDVFAPAAGRLALGVSVARLGRPHPVQRLTIPEGRAVPGGAEGEVLHIDRFGNLITSIASGIAPRDLRAVSVRLGRGRPFEAERTESYADAASDGPLLLASSFGALEIAIRLARASDRWKVRVGTPVKLTWAGQTRK
ncbi:MAG TPA: SAM-dependent chlorinase/fluorinase, partial [Thermoplasmata archaeon]|nr:SAM-dependent chlorinase/fluorinase [Thermoplasmata archaeon]